MGQLTRRGCRRGRGTGPKLRKDVPGGTELRRERSDNLEEKGKIKIFDSGKASFSFGSSHPFTFKWVEKEVESGIEAASPSYITRLCTKENRYRKLRPLLAAFHKIKMSKLRDSSQISSNAFYSHVL